jgi:hypothetical protein
MSRFAELGTRIAADLPDQDPTRPEDEEDEPETATKPRSKPAKDKDMTEEELLAVKAEARAEGFKAATERSNTVLASEHYQGREALAKSLLATDLSAEQIVTSLAAAPKIEPAAVAADPEAGDDAARAEMREAITQNRNSAIEPGQGDGAKSKEQAAASVWDTAIANEFPAART